MKNNSEKAEEKQD